MTAEWAAMRASCPEARQLLPPTPEHFSSWVCETTRCAWEHERLETTQSLSCETSSPDQLDALAHHWWRRRRAESRCVVLCAATAARLLEGVECPHRRGFLDLEYLLRHEYRGRYQEEVVGSSPGLVVEGAAATDVCMRGVQR